MNKKYKLNLLLLIGSIVVSIMLAEGVLQLIGIPAPVVSGWRNKGSAAETNQLGYRGQKIAYAENDYVILLLGDSQVAASACSFDGLPERRLEYHLSRMTNKKNIKVFSIGGIGYGQDQELLLLERYFKSFRADLVVNWLTPANDVWNNIFPTHWPRNGMPKPTYWLEDGKLRGPSEQHGEQLWWSKIKLFALLNRQFQIIDRDGDWEKRLPEPYKPIENYQGTICNDWQSKWDDNYVLMRDENLDTEKSHFAISLTPASPRMHYGLDLTKLLLIEIAGLARKNNGELLVFDVQAPHKEQDVCPEEEAVHKLNGKYYRTSQKQYGDNLNYIKAGLSSFTIPVTIPQWQAGPRDNHHLNERATDQVMADLAKRIIPVIK